MCRPRNRETHPYSHPADDPNSSKTSSSRSQTAGAERIVPEGSGYFPFGNVRTDSRSACVPLTTRTGAGLTGFSVTRGTPIQIASLWVAHPGSTIARRNPAVGKRRRNLPTNMCEPRWFKTGSGPNRNSVRRVPQVHSGLIGSGESSHSDGAIRHNPYHIAISRSNGER